MKEITIQGQTFKYKVGVHCDSDGDERYTTEFYQGTIEEVSKRYILFGEKITKTVPKRVFSLDLNVEDCKFTKADIRERIERNLELLGRKKEIERGEIV